MCAMMMVSRMVRNKIGFNWQVIGKMPRSTENKRALVKTIKIKEFEEGFFFIFYEMEED